jgi:isochorismate hydrolase
MSGTTEAVEEVAAVGLQLLDDRVAQCGVVGCRSERGVQDELLLGYAGTGTGVGGVSYVHRMSTLNGRRGPALLVIDVQNGVVGEAHDRGAVVANVAALVEKARDEGVPVVWVQHHADNLAKGSLEWQYVPELRQAPEEPVVHKKYGDSFEDTDLEAVLAGLGVGHLVVAGAQTDECIRSTIHGAFTRGYDVTLVGDAHTTEDLSHYGAPPPAQVIAHTNLYWKYHQAPGRVASVVDTEDVHFSRLAAALNDASTDSRSGSEEERSQIPIT